MDTQNPLFKAIAQLLIAVMCGQPLLSAAADLRVDSGAGANTQITQAQNGVPVINIATPNGNGLSHNKFTDYNVGQQGLILNNSTDKFTQTQLGGVIIGNNNLNGKSAQLILNEVTGGQASQLKGYTEVAGKQAHVVVANPHGITCDGCGFINTPRATLTTGKPIIEQGQLKRYDVEGGQIEISGAGLNATNVSQFDLITRSAKINAELHANQLNIITGRNSVDAQTLTATAKADRPDDKPSLAIDSSALGGMYAGAIRLVGTEAGVGVKLAGDMAASAGDIRIDANGKLSLARTAANRDLQLNAENIELNADAYAAREVRIKTSQLNVKDSLAAGERINLQTQRLDNMGLIEAGVRADGRVNSGSQLELSGATVGNHGQITSHGEIRGDIQQLDNRSGRISSAGDTQLLVEQLNNREGQIVAQGTLDVEAGHVDNRQGILLAQRSLSVVSETLDNSGGGILAADAHMDIQLTEALNNNEGLLEAGTHLRLVADSLSNAQGQIRALGEAGQSSLVTTGLLSNNQGLIEVGNATLRLESNHLNNEGGYVRHLGKEELQVDMDALGQAGGSFMTNSMLHLSAQEWVNRSLLQAASIELNIERLTQTSSAGLLTAGRLDGHGESWINDGRIEADHDLNIQLNGTYQGNGSLIAQGHLELSAAAVDLASNARLQAGGYGWLSVLGTFANQGKVAAVDWLELSAKSLQNRGSLGAGGELLLVAPDIRNEEGLIFSGEDMSVLSQRIENRRGDFYSLGNLLITGNAQGAMAERLSNLSGSIEAAGNLGISALQIENAREAFDIRKYKYSARLVHVGCTDCSGTNEDALFRLDEIERTEIINTSPQAQLLSGGAMALHSDELDNRYSLIASGGDLQISTGHLNNQGAQTGDVHASRVLKSHRVRAHRVGYQINDANAFSARNWHGSTSYSPGNINADLNNFFNRHIYSVYSTSEPVLKNIEYHHATIQAAGNLQIEANEQINNSLIRPSFSYVAGGNRDVNTSAPGSGITTIVPLNSQLPPDLAQQAVGVPSFTLPSGSNGLFSLSSNPAHSYLIETNPLLADMRQYLSSDYLLVQLGLSTDNMQKRLGDGLYEQRLLREAWTARTGQRFIAGIHSDEAMFRYLMDNAIASKDALSLSLGVSLTSEQVAALTHDIVWMEEREIQGEKVLVPVLYMAQAEGRLAPSGALIQGHDVALISGAALNNQGTLRASHNLDAHADNITNSGLMQANARLQLLASDSIRNTQGGIISGGEVSLVAGQDIINERSVTTHESSIGDRYQYRRDFISSAARIEAEDGLSIMAGRDVLNVGSTLQSGGDMLLEAGRDLVITSGETVDQQNYRDRKGYAQRSDIIQHASQAQAGGHLQASAGRDLGLIASHIKADASVSLEAGGDVTIASAANESHYDAYRKSSGKTVRAQGSRVAQQSSQIEAGTILGVLAGGDLALTSSQLKAGDEAYLVAGGKVQLLAEQDYDYSFSEKKNKGSWGSKSLKSDEHTRITHIGSSVSSGGDLILLSGDEQRYQAAKLNSGGDLTLDSGAGIVFEGVKDLEQKSRIRSKNSWVWQSSEGKGTTDETLMQSQLQAQGEIAIRAAERIQIDIKEVNQQSISQTIDAMVQADPQLAWLKDMEQRGDVDWRQVKELHDSFKYSSSGLSGPAAMVIAIVVAYFTAGAGAGLIGATGTVTAAASNAVASAVISNAAISTINNKGNLGAALKEVTSSENLKSYAVTGITAGLTAGVYDKWTGTQTGASNTATASNNSGILANSGKVAGSALSEWSGVGQFAANQALQNSTSAVLNKALGQDGSFGDALTTTLANTFAAAGFNWVGDFSQNNQINNGSLTKIGLHAIMGGLAAEAAGGDFKNGALVAGANEALIDTLANQYDNMSYEQRSGLLTMNSQVLGVLVASAAGGDEKDMQIGASVAGNATKYNWDLHLPQDMMTYGQAASSLAQHMQEQGASPEELSSALQAMARGDGFSGPDPAKEFLKAWAMTMLSGGGVISTSARGITLIVGGTVGGGSNIVYQISTKELNELNYTDASIATAVGALTQGKGLAGTVGVSMGGAYVRSEIKGTDSTSAVIGAGVGAVSGAGVGKIWSNKASTVMPEKVVEILGMTAGAVTSEITSDTSEAILKSKENR